MDAQTQIHDKSEEHEAMVGHAAMAAIRSSGNAAFSATMYLISRHPAAWSQKERDHIRNCMIAAFKGALSNHPREVVEVAVEQMKTDEVLKDIDFGDLLKEAEE